MDAVFQSAFLQALGWSLLDSLWQVGIVWVIYLAVTRNNRSFTANQRHGLALFSLIGSSLWFVVSFALHFAGNDAGFGAVMLTRFFSADYTVITGMMLPWISVSYLFVTLFLFIRLFRQFHLTSKLATTGLSKTDPEIRVFLQELAGRMGIKKPIRIWISSLVETPLTLGFWRPVILLPVAIVNNLSVKQTESIILHELYHIQRNDFLINLAISIADIMLFFNPFARYFRELIQQERENRCDDMVLQFRYEPKLYAEALLTLEQARTGKTRISLAATGTSRFLLLARVKRMLTGENQVAPVSQKLIAFLFAVCTVAFVTSSGSHGFGPTLTGEQSLALMVQADASNGLNESGTLVFRTTVNSTADNPPPPDEDRPSITAENDKDEEGNNEESGLENELARVIVSEKIDNMITSEVAAEQDQDHDLASFASESVPLEYTIRITSNPVTPPPSPDKPYPYVPRNAFEYNEVRDTILLHGHANAADLKAGIRLTRAIEAIADLDWQKVEQKLDLSNEKINPEKLELELKKALLEIDWKSLDKDLANSLKASNTDIEKYRTELANRYQKFIAAKQQRADAARAAEAAIVEERVKTASIRPAQKPLKVKKIVSI